MKAHIKSEKIHIMSAREKTLHDMPKFNSYQTGHGVWGDTKHNRSKNKRQFEKLIKQQMM